MSKDYGKAATELEVKKVEKRIKDIYGQAEADIEKKMADHLQKFEKQDKIFQQGLKDGTIDKQDYDAWKAGQVFTGRQWQAKKDQIADVLYNANAEAIKIVNGGMISCFAENANWTAYDLEHTAGVNFGFGLYDSNTVTRLIKDDPDLLPYKDVSETKDKAWNKKGINAQVTQSIVQGEGIQKTAKRLAETTGSRNLSQMMRTARTSMTSAQNGGRQQRLNEAASKGIKLHKEWMATFDGHTRDTHRELDGQKVLVNEKFKVEGMEIEFPGDPHAHPSLVYNCRCTLVADLDGYPAAYQRYDNIDGVPVDQMTYKEWAQAKGYTSGIDYSEFGGKEVYDIISKYPSFDDFMADYWENDNIPDDQYQLVSKSILSSKSDEELEELFAKAYGKQAAEKIDDAIDYSKFGGEKTYKIFEKYDDWDDWLAHAGGDDVIDLDEFIQNELNGDVNKAKKLFKEAKSKDAEGVIDYSKFGGEDNYKIFAKYDNLDDFYENAYGDDFDTLYKFLSNNGSGFDADKANELFEKAKKVADKVDYSKFGGEENYKLFSKFDSFDDFIDNAHGEEFDTLYDYITNKLGADTSKADKLFKEAGNKKVKDAVDYSKYGGEGNYKIFSKYDNWDDWLNNATGSDLYDIDDFIQNELHGDFEKAKELFKEAKGKGVADAVDYSKFGGEENYKIFSKYKDWDDWITNSDPSDFYSLDNFIDNELNGDYDKAKKLFKDAKGQDATSNSKSNSAGQKKSKNSKNAQNDTVKPYTQEEKDNAKWAQSWRQADDFYYDEGEKQLNKLPRENRDAVYDYTSNSHRFNSPFYGQWDEDRLDSFDLDDEAGRASEKIRRCTDALSECRTTSDRWLQRGTGYDEIEAFFGVDVDELANSELGTLVGHTNRLMSFTSCGSAKGAGFADNPVIINIYAPKGSQACYVEPISAFSGGSERETLIQRGGFYECTKAERSHGTLYLDFEHHPEKGYLTIGQ